MKKIIKYLNKKKKELEKYKNYLEEHLNDQEAEYNEVVEALEELNFGGSNGKVN